MLPERAILLPLRGSINPLVEYPDRGFPLGVPSHIGRRAFRCSNMRTNSCSPSDQSCPAFASLPSAPFPHACAAPPVSSAAQKWVGASSWFGRSRSCWLTGMSLLPFPASPSSIIIACRVYLRARLCRTCRCCRVLPGSIPAVKPRSGFDGAAE